MEKHPLPLMPPRPRNPNAPPRLVDLYDDWGFALDRAGIARYTLPAQPSAILLIRQPGLLRVQVNMRTGEVRSLDNRASLAQGMTYDNFADWLKARPSGWWDLTITGWAYDPERQYVHARVHQTNLDIGQTTTLPGKLLCEGWFNPGVVVEELPLNQTTYDRSFLCKTCHQVGLALHEDPKPRLTWPYQRVTKKKAAKR